MAHIYGHDSSYVKHLKDKNRLYIFIGLLALLLILLVLSRFISLKPSEHSSTFWLFLIGIVLVIMRIIGLFIDKKNINLLKAEGGLRGEKTVLHLLEKLSDAYNVYRGLQPGTHGDIDLTVVGPTGVFTLEVKSHSGQIDFNGQELTRNGKAFDRNILHQAFGEARSLHKYLWQKTGRDIFVTPIIVFSSNRAFLNFNQNKIDNVYVVKKDRLLEILAQQPLTNFEELSAIEHTLADIINLKK